MPWQLMTTNVKCFDRQCWNKLYMFNSLMHIQSIYRCVLWMMAETCTGLNHERKLCKRYLTASSYPHFLQWQYVFSMCSKERVTCLRCRSVKKLALVLCLYQQVRFSSCPHGQNKPKMEGFFSFQLMFRHFCEDMGLPNVLSSAFINPNGMNTHDFTCLLT